MQPIKDRVNQIVNEIEAKVEYYRAKVQAGIATDTDFNHVQRDIDILYYVNESDKARDYQVTMRQIQSTV